MLVSHLDFRNWVEGNCRDFKALTIEIIGYHVCVLKLIIIQALSSRNSYMYKGRERAHPGLQDWRIMVCIMYCKGVEEGVTGLSWMGTRQSGRASQVRSWLTWGLRAIWCSPYRRAGCEESLTEKVEFPHNLGPQIQHQGNTKGLCFPNQPLGRTLIIVMEHMSMELIR